MKSCCATIFRTRRRCARSLAGLAALGLAFGVTGAAADESDHAFQTAALAADSLTPPQLAPMTGGTRLLWPVGGDAALAAGYRVERTAAGPVWDPDACGSGILDIGCGHAWAGAVPGNTAAARMDVGASWRPLEGVTLGVDYFREQGSARQPGLLVPRMLDFLAPGWYSALESGGDSEGVDLNVAYGFDAGLIGELEIKVQLTHVLDLTPPSADARLAAGPALASDPFTEASIGFNWTRGNFSGSLSSHYTDGFMLDGGQRATGQTTVDINFAWRTPWNASLSLGAQNLLGQDERGDMVTAPELDSAFSRVPYVRYEQDL